MNYNYLGINDLFSVSGEVKQGEVLGRSTFYDLKSEADAIELVSTNEYSFDLNTLSNDFNCSFVYLCTNENNEYFTITIITVISSSSEKVIDDAKSLGKNVDFQEKIIINSLEKIETIKFIGIEDICDINLDINIFQTFYSEFDNFESLKKERLNFEEIEEIVKDIQMIDG